MSYQVRTTPRFEKQLSKLDKQVSRTILRWLAKHIDGADNPRISGKSLLGKYAGQWRYRVGDYRVICQINDGELIILALEVGHRSGIYES
ncbi:type II toxin-antitoxin system RelE/ParE family toxin [Listeria booriae]|uniref:type II toxin-antitoxin system RelE family toxin n=1 Tax=Listeria booriae TaxID=1552123 RepID=UPI0016285C7A|nr:type II toxin-antitoxin system RelE/ParE family toxin [Listeria booriae]MBC1890742.1 type II toxin-antitoxin system RelE/ParE family toxin [Listeria booriae]MBC1896868.1 type II toxin-antitoxin system RelE/ParE family toxin [Listeria booriae]MBC1904943.1 type II toxin-antitoxin system RelE/ParE family toxin [Listeria booriae]MBC2056530.1 type II toxin-antitoxin system RelE/ParE family toxin [Listeria booriae]